MRGKIIKGFVLGTILITINASLVLAKNLEFGKEIKLKEKTNISEVLASPEEYVGKNILIEGKVIDVCKERGCWMKVNSDQKKQNILIKVKDGEMVFPLEARGKNAAIEGELFKVVIPAKEMQHSDHEGYKEANHEHHAQKGEVVYMFKPVAVVITQ